MDRAAELRKLMKSERYMYGYAPELQKYLEDFPESRPPRAEDFIYWSREKFSSKPMISITHVTIYQPPQPDQTRVLIASRSIYASHYLDASISLSAFVEEPEHSRSYLLYVNRSSVDMLRGFFGGVVRAFAGGPIRSGMVSNMELTRQRLESEYRKASPEVSRNP